MTGFKEYFAERNMPLEKLQDVGFDRYGIEPDTISKVAEAIHKRIINGEHIKDITLLHRVMAEAKPVRSGGKRGINQRIRRLRTYAGSLEERIALLERSWWEKFKDKYWWLFVEIEIWQ